MARRRRGRERGESGRREEQEENHYCQLGRREGEERAEGVTSDDRVEEVCVALSEPLPYSFIPSLCFSFSSSSPTSSPTPSPPGVPGGGRPPEHEHPHIPPAGLCPLCTKVSYPPFLLTSWSLLVIMVLCQGGPEGGDPCGILHYSAKGSGELSCHIGP